MHREAPSQVGPRRRCRVLGNLAKQGLRGQKTEKAVLLIPLTTHRQSSQTKGRLGQPRVGRHTNLCSTHNPRGTEDRPGEPKEEHLSPMTKRMGLGN